MGTRAGQKYLYFRTVADEDDDDASVDSAVYPVSSFAGMHPTSDTAITLFFDNQIVQAHDMGSNAFTNKDSVILNVNQGKTAEVMQAIVQAINGNVLSDGWLVVADDATTDYDASTRAATYLTSDITSCGAIAITAAHA